jgi:hypothetical protein
VRGDTQAKCEAFRAFGLVYIREKLAAGGAPAKVTRKELNEAYAKSISVEPKTIDWMFRMRYLDFDALQKAAVANDASMCPIGSSRVVYDTIEAFLEAESGTEGARNVRIAADWCVAKLDVIPRQTSDGRQKDTLVQLWDEQRPIHSCSLKSLFKNGPFSMQKLRHYAQRAAATAAGAAAEEPGPLPGETAAAAGAAVATGESADAFADRGPSSPPPDPPSDTGGGGGDYVVRLHSAINRNRGDDSF